MNYTRWWPIMRRIWPFPFHGWPLSRGTRIKRLEIASFLSYRAHYYRQTHVLPPPVGNHLTKVLATKLLLQQSQPQFRTPHFCHGELLAFKSGYSRIEFRDGGSGRSVRWRWVSDQIFTWTAIVVGFLGIYQINRKSRLYHNTKISRLQ